MQKLKQCIDRLPKKAFDCVTHDWVLKALQSYKISSQIIKIHQDPVCMPGRHPPQFVTHTEIRKINSVCFNRGILIRGFPFHDSSSVLLFPPPSKLLTSSNRDYQIYKQTRNHIFYIDDLKLYARNENEIIYYLQ